MTGPNFIPCVEHRWCRALEFIDDADWAGLAPNEPDPASSVWVDRCERCDELRLPPTDSAIP